MSKLIIKTPGKLYIAGEYAVVSGEEAILMPTSKTLDIEITLSDQYRINNKAFELSNLSQHSTNTYLINALQIAHDYLIQTTPYALHIQSHLTIENYAKLGLGTSGALTIGIIDAITRIHGEILSPLHLYKLGVLAQQQNINKASFGDLATSAQQSWIRYRMPDTTWLKERLKSDSLKTLINKKWPNLMIQPITPLPYPTLVIYTQHPADSTSLVRAVMAHKDTKDYTNFLTHSKQSLNALMDSKTFEQFASSITALHRNLIRLANTTKTPLMTQEMHIIENYVKDHHGVMKFSGAGGGDCVLAFFPTENDYHQAYQTIKPHFPILNSFFKGV